MLDYVGYVGRVPRLIRISKFVSVAPRNPRLQIVYLSTLLIPACLDRVCRNATRIDAVRDTGQPSYFSGLEMRDGERSAWALFRQVETVIALSILGLIP